MRETTLQQIERRIALNDRRIMLRPMNRQELIDLALGIYRRLGGTIIRISAVPSVCAYFVLVYCSTFVLPGFFLTDNPNSQSGQVQEVAVAAALTMFVAIPLFLLATSVMSASISRLVAAQLMDEKLDSLELGRLSPGLIWRTVLVLLYGIMPCFLVFAVSLILLLVSAFSRTGAEVLDAVIALVGFAAVLATFVVFPFVATRVALGPVILAREGGSARDAIKRSKELLAKTQFHPSGTEVFTNIWGLCFLMLIVVSLGSSAILDLIDAAPALQQWFSESAFGDVANQLISLLPLYLAILTVIPAWSVMASVVYFERRIRLEGLDIEILTQDAQKSRRSIRFMP